MNTNDIIEKCAQIADDYAAPNRFSVADCWKDNQSPSEVYDTAATDVGGWIAQEIRALKSSLPAETVSEAMVERAAQAYINADMHGGCHMDWMRATLEAAFVLPGPQVRLLDNDARDGRWIIGYSYRRPFTPVILKKTEHGWVDDGNWYHGEPDFYLPVPMPALPAPPKDGRE